MSDEAPGPSPEPGGPSDAPAAKPGVTGAAASASPPRPAPLRALHAVTRGLAVAEGVGMAACLLTIVVLALFELVTRNLRLRGIVALPPSPPWIDGVMRHSVFLLGFLGAAYATFTRRHIRIDAVTRLLRPRVRLVARAVVTLGAVALCGALIFAGLDFHRVCVEEAGEAASQEQLFTSARGALVIIGGFALVGLHALVHALSDLALLLRGGPLPPGVVDEPHA